MDKQDSLVSKQEANYKTAPDGEPSCGSCMNFISPAACKLVSGTISENGTCDLYQSQDTANPDLASMLFGGAGGES